MSEEVHEIRIHRRKRMAAEDIVFYIFNTIFLLLFAIVTLYPVLNTLAVSFNEGNDAVRGGIHLWPRVFSTKNYEEIIFNRPGIRQGLWITVARTVLGTFTSLAANALLSFILSRKKFLFKSGLSLFWIITMYASAGLIPGLILFRYLHLTSSF
ncbi:MAG: carbohydrate ABC transporter permease, partial [Lachnospiraceae bacterium]|nr:carbohydrate ABC transporter permease [Lachnospiraceae bacterium]